MTDDGIEYYSLKPLLSRGAELSFVVGMRSIGKSYAFKEWALRDYLSTGAEFCFVRRLDSEMAQIKGNFFDDIAGEFGVSIRCRGSKFQIRDTTPDDLDDKELQKWKKSNPWKTFGYAMSLNLQQDYKSGSWPRVNKIGYDEFIIENPNRRYLPDEPDQFLSLMSTVLRGRKGRAVLISNAGAVMNPFFSYYGITAAELNRQEFVSRNGGSVCIQVYRNQQNVEKMRKNTLLGRLASRRHVEYALESKFRDASEDLIDPEAPVYRKLWNLEIDDDTVYTVSELQGGEYYISQYSRNSLETYTIRRRSTRHVYRPEVADRLRKLFYDKRLLFDTLETRLYSLEALFR